MAPKTTTKKVPVTRRALIARINRKLAHDNKQLCASRSVGELQNLGAYYVLDTHGNEVVDSAASGSTAYGCTKDSKRAKDWLLFQARELDVIGEWEELAEE